jgi:GT2 family glycosyltransferase
MDDLAPTRPDVSVVIPGAGRSELTAACIDSLRPALAAASARAEVVYVDDASGDDTPSRLSSRYPSLRIERLAERVGFAAAANHGVRAARGRVVVLLNNDVEVSQDFLDPLVSRLDDAEVFAVTADSLVDGRHESPSHGSFRAGLFYVEQPGLTGTAPLPSETATNLHVSGGFSAFDRRLFLELGGFSAAYHPFYWEDVELSWRAWRRGLKVLFEPRSRVHHRSHATVAALHSPALRRYVYERNRLLFIWRNIRDPELFAEHLDYLLAGRSDQQGLALQGGGMRFHFVPGGIRRALREVGEAEPRRRDRQILEESRGRAYRVPAEPPRPGRGEPC